MKSPQDILVENSKGHLRYRKEESGSSYSWCGFNLGRESLSQ